MTKQIYKFVREISQFVSVWNWYEIDYNTIWLYTDSIDDEQIDKIKETANKYGIKIKEILIMANEEAMYEEESLILQIKYEFEDD